MVGRCRTADIRHTRVPGCDAHSGTQSSPQDPGQYSEHTRSRAHYTYTYNNRGYHMSPWPVLRTYSLAWLLHLHLQQQRGPRVSPGQYSEHTHWRGCYIYTYNNRGGHVSPLASTPNTLTGMAVISTPTTTEGATCLPWPVLRTHSLAWLLHLHL